MLSVKIAESFLMKIRIKDTPVARYNFQAHDSKLKILRIKVKTPGLFFFMKIWIKDNPGPGSPSVYGLKSLR